MSERTVKKMKNELIESFIRDNVGFECSKNYVNEYCCVLTDNSNSVMVLLNIFDSVSVSINNEHHCTYTQDFHGTWIVDTISHF